MNLEDLANASNFEGWDLALKKCTLCVSLICIINRNTGQKFDIVPKTLTKTVKQSSRKFFVGVFLTFCCDGWFKNISRWHRLQFAQYRLIECLYKIRSRWSYKGIRNVFAWETELISAKEQFWSITWSKVRFYFFLKNSSTQTSGGKMMITPFNEHEVLRNIEKRVEPGVRF